MRLSAGARMENLCSEFVRKFSSRRLLDELGRRVQPVRGRREEQLKVIGPLAVRLIFLILFALYGNFKFPATIALGVVIAEPVGALIALKLTDTPFSVSSVLGLLALMGYRLKRRSSWCRTSINFLRLGSNASSKSENLPDLSPWSVFVKLNLTVARQLPE